MAQPVYKHDEDDGDLSIFASGDVVVLACEHGHYWVLESKKQTMATVKTALQKLVSVDEAERIYKAF